MLQVDEAIKKITVALKFARLPPTPLKNLYNLFKDSYQKITKTDAISNDIYGGFFRTLRQFLYIQVDLTVPNTTAIEKHLLLLQAIGRLTDNLQDFDPDKYDNLEIKSYGSHETLPQDPISEIFAKAENILAGSIINPDQALEEITAKIATVNIFIQQIIETQTSIETLQLIIEKIPESEKALFQEKLDALKLTIAQLKPDDTNFQQTIRRIQDTSGRLEQIGGLIVKLFESSASESTSEVDEEIDPRITRFLTSLHEVLESADIVANADILLPEITPQIDALIETRAEEARVRKMQEISDQIAAVLESIEQNEKEFQTVSEIADEDLPAQREKLERLLQQITDINTEAAGVLEQDISSLEDIYVDDLQQAKIRITALEEEARKLIKKIDRLETGAKERERREQEAPKQARAYAKLACAVNAVNKALRGNYIGAKTFEEQCSRTDIAVEKGENKDIWAIFNVLLQRENIKKLIFDSSNKAEIAVEIYGRIFKVTLQKVNSAIGAIIPNMFDVQLQQYYVPTSGAEITLGPPFFTTPLRISKRGNLLTATDSETKATVVRDQYIDYDHQVDAMLRTMGMHMDERGVILPTSVSISSDLSEEPTPANTPQLIVAGTGSGKSGIIATTAMVHGRGVFATQSGALVDGMVRDVNDFIKNQDGIPAAVKLPPDIAREDVAQFLEDHPYTVMSHEQLILYADILRDQHVFIDEVHSIVPKSYDRGSEERMTALKTIITNNKVLGTTATPTAQVRELLGTPIYDLSLHEVQKTLKTIRAISTEDTVIAPDQLAEAAVSQLLTRRTDLQPGMRGYQRDPEKNIRLSSRSQGFIFTDNAQTAREAHALLSGLQDDTVLRHKLNVTASHNRSGRKAEVYDEAIGEQRKIIEANIQIDIIVNLRVSDKTRKDLQKLVRNGKLDELDTVYRESLDKYRSLQLRKEGYIKSAQSKVNRFCSVMLLKLETYLTKDHFTY